MAPSYAVVTVLGTVILGLIVSLWLPGIERNFVHARIQQRIGPPVSSPGLMAALKFFYKKTVKPCSPLPRLYNSLPIVGFISALLILLFLIPPMYTLGALARGGHICIHGFPFKVCHVHADAVF